MASMIELKAADGHKLAAYRAEPQGKPRGAVVVIQEIFGVNKHIKSVADGYAADGYLVIAPAMFDRLQRGYDTGYTPPEIEARRALMQKADWKQTMQDAAAAVEAAKAGGKVGIVGYCWGGTLAWLAATRLSVDCAVGYYGSMTIDFIDETPACPVTMMLGETDASFPPENIEAIRARHPDVVVFTYPAGHGFACDQRGSWHELSARLAGQRTLEIFRRYLG